MTYQIVLKELAQLQAKDNQGKAASMSYIITFVAIAGRNNPAEGCSVSHSVKRVSVSVVHGNLDTGLSVCTSHNSGEDVTQHKSRHDVNLC